MKFFNEEKLLLRFAPIIFVLLWSTGYLSGRILRPYVDPLTFSAFRFAIASGLLTLLVFTGQSQWPRSIKTWLHLSVCGVLIQGFFVAGMMTAVNLGLEMSTAALVGGMQPILTAVLAAFWIRETIVRRQQLGFVLGFFGVALVVWEGSNMGSVPKDGLIISIFAVLGITLGTIYQKRFIPNTDLLAGTAIQFAAASIPVAILALIFEEHRVEWNAAVIGTGLWLVFVQSIGAVLILYYMIRAGAVSRVASLFYLVPPICALQGYFFFNEQLTVLQMLGIALSTVAVVIIVEGGDSVTKE